jgi:hypothetical protein
MAVTVGPNGTPILDSFSGADGPLSASWETPVPNFDAGTAAIRSNQFSRQLGGPASEGLWTTSFSTKVEVWCQLGVNDPNHSQSGLLISLPSLSWAGGGFAASMLETTDNLDLHALGASDLNSPSVTIVTGDYYGIAFDGSSFYSYHAAATDTSWTLFDTWPYPSGPVDPSGYIGLIVIGDDSYGISLFGGGTYPVSTPSIDESGKPDEVNQGYHPSFGPF